MTVTAQDLIKLNEEFNSLDTFVSRLNTKVEKFEKAYGVKLVEGSKVSDVTIEVVNSDAGTGNDKMYHYWVVVEPNRIGLVPASEGISTVFSKQTRNIEQSELVGGSLRATMDASALANMGFEAHHTVKSFFGG